MRYLWGQYGVEKMIDGIQILSCDGTEKNMQETKITTTHIFGSME